jgi:hypothetical protein
MQRQGYGLAAPRGDMAMALHEWHSALLAADASVEAEIYRCVIALVMEYLEPCATIHGLLDAYYCPELGLLRLVKELCTGGRYSCYHDCCCGRRARCSCAILWGKRSGRPVSHGRFT